ncbi:hypothetical protein [Kineothrix sedimenti]|uniref:Cytochrome c oxidase subunit 4 n=1 Tax=Kineothrix sedimenti TaxID=3123317 RepID=A0ABZ3F4A6_9FIRM
MSAFFNLGSFVLGIMSWIIPIVAINRYRKGYKLAGFSIYSFSCCAIALVFQLFEIRHRVIIEDFSAIMDTIGATSAASVILVIITIILNITALCLCKTKDNNYQS